MKLASSIALTMLICVSVSAQISRCNVRAENAPAIRGVKLGMTVEEVKGVFKNLEGSADETGYFHDTIQRFWLPDKIGEGLIQIDLGFLDGKVVSIIVVYDNKTVWPSAEQFALAISKTLHLPTAWEKKTNPTNPSQQVGLQLQCEGITVGITPAEVSPSKSPILLLFRDDTKPIRDRRRAQIEEQRRRTFKP